MAERGEPGGACQRLRGRAPRRILADLRSERAVQSRRPSLQSGRARPAGDGRQVGARGDSGPVPGFGREPERAARLRQQHPPGASQRRGHYDRPHHLKHHFRPRRIVRRGRTGRNLPQQTGDFGQTMFVWGVPSGSLYRDPHISVPRRNAIPSAAVVDSVGDPVGWVAGGIFFGWPWSIGTGALSAPSPISASGNRPRVRRSISTASCARAYYQTRRAQLREALGLPPQIESPATARPGRRAAGHR